MGKSQETWNKKEKEKKKQKKREEKELRKQERKANSEGGGLENMMAYVDEFGNITSTPPDPTKKRKPVKAESIEIGVPKREEVKEEDLIRKGKVTFYDDSKGYGFIKDSESQDSIFTHVNSHVDTIKEGDKVTFKVEQGLKGPNAVDVKLVDK